MTDKHHIVDPGFLIENRAKVTFEIGERSIEACKDAAACLPMIDFRVDWNSGKAAVTRDDSGNALCHFESHVWVVEESTIVMRVGIYKPGCERLSLAVDFLLAW